MATHLFYHAPATSEQCALQSWLSLWSVFQPEDTVLVLDLGDALPALPARAIVTKVTGNADGTPFAGFAQAINRGAELADEEWICVWRSDYLYPYAYHAALQDALPTSKLILPYETFHGLHYCDAAWCQANGEAILRATEDELLTHAVVAPVYQTRSFPHFAVRTDLWRHTGGFDSRLRSERAVVAEWIQRIACDTECPIACPFEMIAFRQNANHRIEVRLTTQEVQQAERELQAAGATLREAYALLHDLLPLLRPRRPSACYSPFPRPARPVSVLNTDMDARPAMLLYACEQLQALALPAVVEYASFLTRLNNQSAEAYHLLGTALHAQGRRYEAVDGLGRSLMLDRGNRQYMLDLLAIWRDLNDLECGSFVLKEIAQRYREDAEIQEMANWFITQIADKKESYSLHRFFQPGALVFDVGAHYGEKAQEMLRQGAGALVCFDCQPNCVAALQQKYADALNVVVMPVGLADKPGEIRFSICSAGEGLSTFSTEWKTGRFADMNWNQTIVAPVTTLDLMIAHFGRPTYCKIDVEGFEYSVLQGLTQPIPCLSFEFAKEFLAQTRLCIEYLVTLGFEGFNVMIGDTEKLLFGEAVAAERLLMALEQSPDQRLWGDVYAFCDHANGETPSLERLEAARSLLPDFVNSSIHAAA
jgi:FkbM family methyltransferase